MVRHHNIISIIGNIISIIGNIITIRVADAEESSDAITRFSDLAIVEDKEAQSLAQVIKISGNEISLQVFSGMQGISNSASIRFLGSAMKVTYSPNILGRVFNSLGEPIDGGSQLEHDPKSDIDGP